MRLTLKWVVLILAVVLTGCATQQQKAVNAEVASTRILCVRGDDCEVKWGRALSWVNSNSNWKIRSATDSLISTESGGDSGETAASFSILKTPLGGGHYQIEFQAGCANFIGCVP